MNINYGYGSLSSTHLCLTIVQGTSWTVLGLHVVDHQEESPVEDKVNGWLVGEAIKAPLPLPPIVLFIFFLSLSHSPHCGLGTS